MLRWYNKQGRVHLPKSQARLRWNNKLKPHSVVDKTETQKPTTPFSYSITKFRPVQCSDTCYHFYWSCYAPTRSDGSARTKSRASGAASPTRRFKWRPSSGPASSPSTATPTTGRTLMASSSLSFPLSNHMRTTNTKAEKWPLRCTVAKILIQILLGVVGFVWSCSFDW